MATYILDDERRWIRMTDWKAREFSDEEASWASSLSVRAIRSLSSIGVIGPLDRGRGRGRRRTYNHLSIARAIMVGGLSETGLPLDLSSAIVMFLPLEDEITKEFLHGDETSSLKEKQYGINKSDDDFYIYRTSEGYLFLSSQRKTVKPYNQLTLCFGRIVEDEEGEYLQSWIKDMYAAPKPRHANMRYALRYTKFETTLEFLRGAKRLISEDTIQYIREHKTSKIEIVQSEFSRTNTVVNIALNLSMRLRMGKAGLLHPELMDGSRDRE
jgi:DNA-binding transcriptional MerR regulator